MNNPHDRVVFNPREKPLSTDWNSVQSELDRTYRELALKMFAPRVSGGDPTSSPLNAAAGASAGMTGFVGDGFMVRAQSPVGMQVVVKNGFGYMDLAAGSVVNGDAAILAGIGSLSGVDDLSRYKPLSMMADLAFNVPAAPSAGNSRIDIIEVLCDRRLENASSRQVFNVGLQAFAAATVDKTLAFNLDGRDGTVNDPADSTTGISYKVGQTYVGTSYVGANAPATTSGYVKIAEIYVGPSVTTITQDKIGDFRPLLFAKDEAYVEGVIEVYQDDDGVNDFSQMASHTVLNAPPGVVVAARGLVIGDELAILLMVSAGAGYSRPGALTVSARRVSGRSAWYAAYVGADPTITTAASSGDVSTWNGQGSPAPNLARGQMFMQATMQAGQMKFSGGYDPFPVSAGGVPANGDHALYHYRMGLPRV